MKFMRRQLAREWFRFRQNRISRFPLPMLSRSITPHTRLIAVANPNNPTGRVARCPNLARDCKAAPEAALLVDEAYFEFYGRTVLAQWRELPNLFVSRTFSKAYGMAGLRIGVLTGNAKQIAMVRRDQFALQREYRGAGLFAGGTGGPRLCSRLCQRKFRRARASLRTEFESGAFDSGQAAQILC